MKNRFENLSVGKKLQVVNLAIISLVTLLTTIFLSLFLYSSLQGNYEKYAHTLSDLLAESANSALIFNDPKVAGEVLANLRKVDDVAHAEIYDKSGKLFASYIKDGSPFIASLDFDPVKLPHGFQFGSLTLNIVQPMTSIASDQEQIGTIWLQMNLRAAYTQLVLQIVILLLLGVLSFALIAFVLNKLQSSITQPLVELAGAMRKISREGNFSEQANVKNKDEIGALSGVFRAMVQEISKREDSLNAELTERRKIEAKLSRMANFDAVTNLPNRHSFNNQIERALLNYKYEHERFALFFIDLDNFKFVNDTFGHQAGDLLLSTVAERLRHSLRAEDFIARLGGDEFVVLMSNHTDIAQIDAVAEKIITALRVPFLVEDREVFIGASIGITICPDNGETSEMLQSQADSAMYQAKNLGKNNFQYYQSELRHAQEHRLKVEAELRRSLERNEIVPYYQPIIDISTRQIAGFETLVRWIKTDGKIINPDDFIPLAEELGLIIDIGAFVMQAAAIQTLDWVKRFGPIFTAVNFSSRQFKLHHLADDVIKTLKSAGLEHQYFEMEITESVLMDNTSNSLDTLEQLSQNNISISIDDFGTGYSSLSYLTSFPVKKLKIDRSFVSKLPDDKNALAVVTAIIGIAHSLNLKVVAEGIETEEQLECLIALGCHYGQGYLFSRPVPAVKAGELLQAKRV
jgi:diguanylate cyclase (GGDEF)-like protein